MAFFFGLAIIVMKDKVNMKKIFFVDIDGTIIDSTNGMLKVSKKTRYAFKELKRNNYVFISSGRCEDMIADDIKSLKPSGYILNNGACCLLDDKEIFAEYLPNDQVRELVDYIRLHNGNFFLEKRHELRVKDIDDEAMKEFVREWGIPDITSDKPVLANDDFHMAMALFDNVEELEAFGKRFEEHFDIRNHNGYISCDINLYGINKGSGVKEVLSYLNIDKSLSYAFGDELNDLEMMVEAGHAIVMGNGNPRLKELAEEIADSAVDDGFYNYLVSHKIIAPIHD